MVLTLKLHSTLAGLGLVAEQFEMAETLRKSEDRRPNRPDREKRSPPNTKGFGNRRPSRYKDHQKATWR